MSGAPTSCSNRADYRLSPFELESALIEHPAVAEAAVAPAPDAIRLTIPKAYVTLAAGHAPDRAAALAIFAYLRDRLAPYQRIRRIEFGELPKTASGEIRRADLRAREEALAAKGERAGARVLAGGFSRGRVARGVGADFAALSDFNGSHGGKFPCSPKQASVQYIQ